MRGLILKDMFNQKGQIITYLFILVLWIAVGYFNKSAAFFIGAMQMLVVMIPLISMAYDEKMKWESFALTMPVTRKEIVVSKYIFTLILVFIVVVISFVGALIIGGEFEESLLIAAFSFPLGLAINGVILPIIFRFGVEKGRFVFLGIAAVFILAGFLIAKAPIFDFLDMALSFTIDNVWIVVLICWVLSLAFTGISLTISCYIYRKREF